MTRPGQGSGEKKGGQRLGQVNIKIIKIWDVSMLKNLPPI